MSEAIDWQALSDKDKVQLIIEQVFQIVPDNQGANEKYSAFWDELDGRWQLNDGVDTISFDPLHHMEDAWQIVEELYDKHYDVLIEVDRDNTHRYCVSCFSRGKQRIVEKQESDTSINDAMCIVALRAVGVVITADEPPQGEEN